jgi:hypothetical protein
VRLVAIGAFVAAVAALPAAAAPVDRALPNATRVVALGATGGDVVYATEGSDGLCGQIHLWRTATRATIAFPRPLRFCEETSTGTGIAAVATSGGRVLWLSYTGGNFREWRLYTASTAHRAAREVEFVPVEAEAPAPIVLGRPDAHQLPVAVGAQLVVLRPDGSRAFTWNAGERITAVAANAGRLAVLLGDGRVVVLSSSGTKLAEFGGYAPGAVRTIRARSRGAVIELAGSRVEIRTTASRATIALPRSARLLDYVENRILYAKGREVHAIRVADRADALLRIAGPPPSPVSPVLAQLTRRGLAYARGRAVSWAAWSTLAPLVRGASS